MTRISLIASAALIAVTGAAGIAWAKGGPDGARGPNFERMMEEVDANGDGQLTRAELEAARAARFADADTNGDGQLTVEEMQAAASARDSERRTKRIEARLERLDTNNDGQLSLEEMAASDRRIDRMFKRLDANDDGAITQAEFEDMIKHRGKDRSRGE